LHPQKFPQAGTPQIDESLVDGPPFHFSTANGYYYGLLVMYLT